MEQVTIRKTSFWALITGLIGCLLVISFLLGRTSRPKPSEPPSTAPAAPSAAVEPREPAAAARPAPPGEPVAPAPVHPRGAALTAPPPATAEDIASGQRPRAPVTSPGPAPAPREADIVEARVEAAAPSRARTEGASIPPETEAVVDYFRRIAQIQTQGDEGSNPRDYAQGVLTAALQGDASGFDKLARAVADADRSLKAMTPPPPCAGYHRALLSVLAENRTLLSKLRNALAKKDPQGLSEIAGYASTLQERTQALEREEAALKAKYGLARP